MMKFYLTAYFCNVVVVALLGVLGGRNDVGHAILDVDVLVLLHNAFENIH